LFSFIDLLPDLPSTLLRHTRVAVASAEAQAASRRRGGEGNSG